ncbi:hypothetical protein DFQ30_005539 [Apophysomyces sp. BC1015]|nr:hypothetical protein DFQ30_005539 [Apophysomyces sp. BC1015]
MGDARTQLLSVLHDATSQDYVRMKQAEELLKNWESEPRFFATLQRKIMTLSTSSPIAYDEKAEIRRRLLEFMDEPSIKLTAQNAVIVARIARLDFPLEWPELLPTILQVIETANTGNEENTRIIHDRSIRTLHEVLYELSTRSLSAGRRQFAEIAPRTFQTVSCVYVSYSDRAIARLVNTSDISADVILHNELEIVSTCLRCLRILMVSGIKDVHKYDETKNFIDLSWRHLQKYVEIQQTIIQHQMISNVIESKAWEILETVIEEYGAMYLGLQKAHPISVALCPVWTDIVKYYWQKVRDTAETTTRGHHISQQFLLQGMLLVKDTIRNGAHSSENLAADVLSTTKEENALANQARRMLHDQFLTPDFVNSCAETLITKYMLLTTEDFEKWEDDPEGWANAVDTENWEFELRPCAEVTFMGLLSQYRNQLCPILLDLVEKISTVTDYQGLLFKDAVYCSIGLGVQSLYGRLDFENFLVNRLIPEISNKESSLKFLRRRIAWMLGKWVTEGISADCRIAVYEALLQLMAVEEDVAVRLSAAHSLKMAIDDWEFDISILLPYLGTAMDLLMSLLNIVEESDTVMKIISDLNTITDRTGYHMVPYAAKIIEQLGPLWDRAQNEPLFLSALVVTFTKIAAILKEENIQLYGLLIPMVEHSVNKNNDAHVYLLEDALDLWWTLLQSAPEPNPQLISLLPYAIALLDFDTENMRKVLTIIESYILLDPQTTLQQYALALFTRLASYISNSREQVSSNISNTIELAMRSVPVQMYGNVMMQSGLLDNILHTFLQDQMYGYALMNYMSLFARLAIEDATLLENYIQLAGQKLYPSSSDFLGEVLDKWLEKFDNISHPRTRKLVCMAFTNMLRTNHPSMLARLPNLMAIWMDVVTEIKESDGNDALLHSEADMEGDLAQLEECAETSRKQELSHRDPVYTTDMVAMVRQTLAESESQNGGAQRFQELYLSKIDSTVLEQIQLLLSL